MRENCPDIPCIILANKIDGNFLKSEKISQIYLYNIFKKFLADMDKTKLKFKFA